MLVLFGRRGYTPLVVPSIFLLRNPKMPTVAQINALLDNVIANPKPDYTIGDKKVTWSAYYKWLLDARKSLLETPDADIEFMAFDFDINEFGIDNTQFEP
jgi:hypothetical protein